MFESAQAAGATVESQTPKTRRSPHKVSSKEDGRHDLVETHSQYAADTPPIRAIGGELIGGHIRTEPQLSSAPDQRFTDTKVMEIVQLHRLRRRWLKARNALTLQGKAICRAFLDGDKAGGQKAYDRIIAGKPAEDDAVLEAALIPFIPSVQKFDLELRAVEKQLSKLARGLPIAGWAKDVRGLGEASVAAIVGEAGDLSKYPTVSGVWKRMGLAVLDGERQRKCADPDKAIVHGYSPERRSVVWVMADAMAKHQRAWVDKDTGEIKKEAGPYGVLLEGEKAKALSKGWSPARAENHAKRVMSKAVLKDMTLAWRAAL